MKKVVSSPIIGGLERLKKKENSLIKSITSPTGKLFYRSLENQFTLLRKAKQCNA